MVTPTPRQSLRFLPMVDPTAPEETPKHRHSDRRTVRGGSWYVALLQCRSSVRAFAEAKDAFSYHGFRVVKEEALNNRLSNRLALWRKPYGLASASAKIFFPSSGLISRMKILRQRISPPWVCNMIGPFAGSGWLRSQ